MSKQDKRYLKFKPTCILCDKADYKRPIDPGAHGGQKIQTSFYLNFKEDEPHAFYRAPICAHCWNTKTSINSLRCDVGLKLAKEAQPTLTRYQALALELEDT